ncbi:hypothetical protein DMH01_02900 [Amycolatopsis sp. WAC 04182]|uniref:hypothetical protein n=1 Tax=Amycolatopsis sp. WAC 04182 TaxID=2203198 RepID=UPI000F7A53CB|nr:hypothetical protein [Amycolatopsis sp. WAC 04182]RSN65352.1 hypothetical protein DMH01_02900 [Amycolatopsis sp. WAC 04182]
MSIGSFFSGFPEISVRVFICALIVLIVIYATGAVIYSLFLWKRKDGEPFELRMPFLKLKTGHRDEGRKEEPPAAPE